MTDTPCEKHQEYRQDCPDCGDRCWLCFETKDHPSGHCHATEACYQCQLAEDVTVNLVAERIRTDTGTGWFNSEEMNLAVKLIRDLRADLRVARAVIEGYRARHDPRDLPDPTF